MWHKEDVVSLMEEALQVVKRTLVTCYLTQCYMTVSICFCLFKKILNYLLLLILIYLKKERKERKITVVLLLLCQHVLPTPSVLSLILFSGSIACILGPFVVSAAPLHRSASPPPPTRPQSSVAKTLPDPPEAAGPNTLGL